MWAWLHTKPVVAAGPGAEHHVPTSEHPSLQKPAGSAPCQPFLRDWSQTFPFLNLWGEGFKRPHRTESFQLPFQPKCFPPAPGTAGARSRCRSSTCRRCAHPAAGLFLPGGRIRLRICSFTTRGLRNCEYRFMFLFSTGKKPFQLWKEKPPTLAPTQPSPLVAPWQFLMLAAAWWL